MNLKTKTYYSGFWACLLASVLFACTSSEFSGGGDKSADDRALTGGKGKDGGPGGPNGKNAHADGEDGSDANDGNDGVDGKGGKDSGHTDENDGGPDNGSKNDSDGNGDTGGPDGGGGHNDGNDDNGGGHDSPNIDSDDGTSTDGEDAVGDDGSQSAKVTSDLTLKLTKENDPGECGDEKTKITVESYKDGEVIKSKVVGCPLKGRPITVADMCRKTGKTCLKITFNYDNGDTVQDTWQNQTGCVYMESLSSTSFKVGWDYDGAGLLGSCRPYEDDVIEVSCAQTKDLQLQSCD